MKLYINTFGGFDIKYEDNSIFKRSDRTYKLYKLFQYFLTFRNKKLLPETITENLWSDSESSDPKNMLRTQIFRLRQIIKTLLPQDADIDKYLNINFINGCYCLEIGEKTIVDVDEFEKLINQGDYECSNNKESAIDLYQSAISIYKGLYLSDYAYEVWLVPTRNYYQRLYLKTLYKLIDMFNEKKQYDKIISLCEESLLIEPYEEQIHVKLMEAMLKIGQSKSALSHYEYAITLLEKEMGAKHSIDLSKIEKKIYNSSMKNSDLNILIIDEKLEDSSELGAMYCEFEYFKFLFNIQKRKSLRNDEHDYYGIITLNNLGNIFEDKNDSNKWSDVMKQILSTSLRKEDVFTFWNDNQVLMLLHNVKDEGTKIIEDRIRKSLNNFNKSYNYDMGIVFQPISSNYATIK